MNEQPAANYDTPWKEALQQYFEPFLSFFFPKVHALIDWGQPPESLDKELEQILRQADSGERVADKLFKVWLLDGKTTWVLVHVEVQSQYNSDFAKRIYQYSYRAFDLYEQPVISLAVLGDKGANWRPKSYGYALGGCKLKLKFPIVKLLDYQAKWQNLEKSTNPFAIMTMAHLTTMMTQGKPQMRQQGKWELVRRLLEKGYDQEDIRKLFRAIDWMMTLPEELQQSFEEQLSSYQKERQMPLLSHMEIRGMQRGIEQGAVQNAHECLLEVLTVRFEVVPPEVIEAINQIKDVSVLKQLHRQAITISSMVEFQQLLSHASD
ncbi:MAG: transposase [Symploca sp. SIO2D2]|nr:transposase [Symploca sp. SIO2D2]